MPRHRGGGEGRKFRCTLDVVKYVKIREDKRKKYTKCIITIE